MAFLLRERETHKTGKRSRLREKLGWLSSFKWPLVSRVSSQELVEGLRRIYQPVRDE